ncbi:MAG: hypothetical protein KJO11_11140 [Gemmatimonadetes bacterium]|nr:hypothetical protein [Gemmatimonadota bacterium]
MLERRLDSLLVVSEHWAGRAREERIALGASVETELPAPVTRTAGGLTIRALPRDMEAAVDLFTRTWSEHFAPVMGPPPQAIRDLPLTYYDARGPWNPLIGENRGSQWPVIVEPGVDPKARARTAFSAALVSSGPGSVARWSEFSGFDPKDDPLRARRQLSAVASRSARECFRGDRDACTVTLGLRPDGWTDEDVVRAWYEPGQLRELLVRRRRIGRSTDLGGLDAADVLIMARRASVDSEAGETARALYWQGSEQVILHMYAPADRDTRASLLRVALRLGGGHEAVKRWMALPAETPLEEALEEIAGRSLPAVIEAWYAQIVGNGDSQTPNDSVPTRSTLAWIGILSAFAMTSTRWRIGR